MLVPLVLFAECRAPDSEFNLIGETYSSTRTLREGGSTQLGLLHYSRQRRGRRYPDLTERA
jgi:hypothetical protein